MRNGFFYSLNARNQRLVLSRFSAADMRLSEEFTPTLAPALISKLATPDDARQALARLYVTGAAVADGRLLLLSAAHQTLVSIDLASRQAVEAVTVELPAVPAGLAIREGRLYVLGEDASLVIFE